jgi:hypothetical protein
MKRGKKVNDPQPHPPPPSSSSPPRYKKKSKRSKDSFLTSDNILIVSSVALLASLIFFSWTLWHLVSDSSTGITRFISNLKTRLVDPNEQFANLQFFDRLNHLLENKSFHDDVVQAIANLSFIPFIASHAVNLTADCTAGWSHDIILRSMVFLTNYSVQENVSECFDHLSAQTLIGCSTFEDVRPAVQDFIVNNSNHVGDECLAKHLKAVVEVAVEKETLNAGIALFEFIAEYDFQFVDDGKICRLAQYLVDQIDEWEAKTTKAVCALSQKIECSAFEPLDLNSLCLPALPLELDNG